MKEFYAIQNMGKQYFTGAPTYTQVKMIFWNDFKAFIPNKMRDKVTIREGDLSLVLRWTEDPLTWTTLKLLSLDRPQRFEGTMWAGGVLDEIADVKVDSWKQHIYPSLADSNGWCILLGVPEGPHFYREYIPKCRNVYVQKNDREMEITVQEFGDEEWHCYTWFSSLVLPEKFLSEARRTMDARTYAQEFEAEILAYEGALYYNFDRTTHVTKKETTTNSSQPLWLSCDFNKSPMVWEVAQTDTKGGRMTLKIVDEVTIPYNAKTESCIARFTDKYKGHKNKALYLTGDASSNYESWRDHTTDYIIIGDYLKQAGWTVTMRVPKSNPNINNRVNVVCSLLKSAEGHTRLYINDNCTYLVGDMEQDESDGKGGKVKTIDPNRTHGSDCLDYLVWQLFAKEFYKSEVRQL